jgi:hypothetical protein
MTELAAIFAERGDLAHLALLLWATSASALAWFALRELTAASRRFDDFVRELARFNETFRVPGPTQPSPASGRGKGRGRNS